MVFPKLHIDQPKKLLTDGSRLTVDGAENVLKAGKLAREKGETSLTVKPQMGDYQIKLIGTDNSCEHLRALFQELMYWRDNVKGLSPSGTVFKIHTASKVGIRLNPDEPMMSGRSYYLVFHEDHGPKSVPRALIMHDLGNLGMWKAWELQLSKKMDAALGNWCATLGHSLRM